MKIVFWKDLCSTVLQWNDHLGRAQSGFSIHYRFGTSMVLVLGIFWGLPFIPFNRTLPNRKLCVCILLFFPPESCSRETWSHACLLGLWLGNSSFPHFFFSYKTLWKCWAVKWTASEEIVFHILINNNKLITSFSLNCMMYLSRWNYHGFFFWWQVSVCSGCSALWLVVCWQYWLWLLRKW